MAELRITGLRKAFGSVQALDGVDLTVHSGTLVAVLGPSGCGKTTLLRCVAGFEAADAGEIRLGGRVLGNLPPERRRVAIVPQEGALFPHLSVYDNVAYGLDRPARRSGRVDEVLALMGLSGYERRMPYQLSGGQQQRVAVARALAPRPPAVLLDEPFSALDAALRTELRQDVRDALRADGATAVLVTHDQGEALSIADQVAVLRAGRIVQSGPPAEVYQAPADLWVARFVGEAVVLPATVHDGHSRTVLGDLVVDDGLAGPATVLIRPEQLDLLPEHTPGAVPATVVRHHFHGHDALVQLRLDDGTEVAARVLATDPVPTRVTVRVRGKARAYPPPAPSIKE
jgi:iron(III) transport system ATP-binding protein